MRIQLGHAYAKLVEATEDEKEWLWGYLSYEDPSAYFKTGQSSRRSLLDDNGAFPAGFLASVWRERKTPENILAGGPCFAVAVEDRRYRPCEPDWTADIEWIRHHPAVDGPITYLEDALRAAVARTRGIVQSPTGSGKSHLLAALTKVLPCRWLLLTPSDDLVNQTAGVLEKFAGEEPGRCGGGRWDISRRVTLSTFQTFYRKLRMRSPDMLDFLKEIHGVAVDEAHQIPAETYFQSVMACRRAYWRFGVSATPLDRTDMKSLLAIGATGEVVYRIKAMDLVRLGVLSEPDIRIVPVQQAKSQEWEWRDVHREMIVQGERRNATLVNIADVCEKPAWLFVTSIDHGKDIERRLRRKGIPCDFVWGAHFSEQRQRKIRDQRRGATDVLVCSSVFATGIDYPELACVINGAGGSSVIAALQRLGRGSRTHRASGKTKFQVWDIRDIGHRWVERHSEKRIRAYKSEGYTVTEHPEFAAPVPDGVVLPAESDAAAARREKKEEADILEEMTGLRTLRRR